MPRALRRAHRPRTGHARFRVGTPSQPASGAHRIPILSALQTSLAFIAAEPDIEQNLMGLVRELQSRLNVSHVAIGVVQGDELVFEAVMLPYLQPGYRLAISEGICGRVATSGIAELVDDAPNDPAYVTVVPDVAREICVPVHVGGDIWGVIVVEASNDTELGTDALQIFQTLASSLGLAVERSRKQRAEEHRLTQLAELQRIAGRIAGRVDSSPSNVDILTDICQTFGYSGLGLGIVRDDRIQVYYAYQSMLDGEAPVRTSPMAGIVGRVAQTGEAVFARDVDQDPDYRQYRPDTTQEICVPVRNGDTLVGVLNAEATSERTLDGSDLDILLTVGDHFGSAIASHLRLKEMEWRNQQLHLLDRVTSVIASQITIRDTLPLVLAEIEGAFGYGSSGIGLVDGDRIHFAAIRDSNEDNIHDYFKTHGVSIATGVTGMVARTGTPIFIDDVRTWPDYLPTSPNIQQEICVPIRAEGRVVGVLNVETPEAKPLGPSDLEILSTIGNHLGMAFERSDAYEAERRSRTAMEAMQRVSTIVSSTLDPDDALRRIVETLAETFRYPYVSIYMLEGDDLFAAAWTGLEHGHSPPAIVPGAGVVGRVVASNEAELAQAFSTEDEAGLARIDTNSQIGVPIHSDGVFSGVLCVEGNESRSVTDHDLHLLQTFAEHAGTTIANARRHEYVQHLAMRDPITGLPNYRQFQLRLVAEIARADRHARPVALLVIDLDGFKGINDAFGHLAGDEILREIGARLKAELRESDTLARYAGDEFVIILPETTSERATLTASRLRAAINDQPFLVHDGSTVDVSIAVGAAGYPDNATDTDDLIRAADRAMYEDKRDRSGEERRTNLSHSTGN